jgi:FkbM family methyltransferase
MKLKKRLKKALKSVGYDLVKLNGGLGKGTMENELMKFINEVDTDLILDIGANRGQFGKAIINYGYKKNLLSFEPLSNMYKILESESEKHPNWHLYERCCVGNEEKTTTINVSNLVGNSSVLDIKSTKFNVNNSHYIAKEEVPQITLANLNNHALIKNSKNVFIKMDIQGFEHFVIEDLPNINFNVVGFYIELSLVNLYDGQKDYLYICNQLKQLGYDLVYIMPESIRSNRMIQVNGIFLHNSKSFKA